MIVDRSYQAVTGRMAQIIENAMGVDYITSNILEGGD